MQEWFKYETGYVNVDDTNFYLSNTGNWHAISNLSEKTKEVARINKLRSFRIQVFLVFFILASVTLFILTIQSNVIIILPTLLLPLFAWYLYNYMIRDVGPSFKIPIHKIDSIRIYEKYVLIEFENAHNKHDTQKLNAVEDKGILLLSNFSFTKKY